VLQAPFKKRNEHARPFEPGPAMGQCVAASPFPSALQLCESVERLSRASRAQEDPEDVSIWHVLTNAEVRALGEIVARWSKGKLDGPTARQQFQIRVLRGQTQAAMEMQNASSAFLRAGLDGALAGIAMGAVMGPAPQGMQQPQMRPGSQANVAVAPDPAMPATSGHSLSGMPPAGGGGPGEQGVFSALAGGIFGGLAAAVVGGARAGARTQNVFSAIDSIFLHSTHDDSWGMAMNELGLDGPRALPGEVRSSFQQKAKGILEMAPQQQAANAAWLDIVMLCLCVEIIRHLKAPNAGRNQASQIAIGQFTMAAATGATSSSSSTNGQAQIFETLQGPRHLLVRMDGPSEWAFMGPGVLRQENGIFDIGAGWSQTNIAIARPGPALENAAFRMDPDFLRERVVALLEVLLGAGIPRQPSGLSMAEIEEHCPVGIREATHDDHCPICLEPCVVEEAVRTMPCKHMLHKECCEAWLQTADTCPTCRYQIVRT